MMSLKDIAKKAFVKGAGIAYKDDPEEILEEFELWWQETGYDNIEIP